jgi:hypothetical protein
MVMITGNAGRAVTASTGVQVPLEPRTLSAQEISAREARQIAVIEAVEQAKALAAEAAGTSQRTTASELAVVVSRLQTAITRAEDLSTQAVQTSAAEVTRLRERLAQVEQDLAASQDRVEALIVQLAAPVPGAEADLVCLGGCGVAVSAEYVTRTGRRWHGNCAGQVPAAVREVAA